MPELESAAFTVFPIAISEFEHHDNVPEIEEDMRAVVEMLEELGGVGVPWTVGPAERDSIRVKQRLSEWSGHPEPRYSVLVWVGHGISNPDYSWLLTHETAETPIGDAFAPNQLAEHIDREWRTRRNGADEWALVVVQACGASDFAWKAAQALPSPCRMAIIGVGGSGASDVGYFRRALETVLAQYNRLNDELIDVSDLVQRLRQAMPTGVVLNLDLRPAPPLRRRRLVEVTATLQLDAYAELEALLNTLTEDERHHFVPKASGGELKELAWSFVGRKPERTAISKWLTDSDSGMLVVTGPAGSGKSALLGNVLVQANPGLRELLVRTKRMTEVPADGRPPDGVFDAVVHLAGLDAGDVVRRLALAAELPGDWSAREPGTPYVERLLAGIERRNRRFTVLADALDEAQEPSVIAGSVLRRVAALPQTRVVVGSRSSSREDPDQHDSTDDLLTALGVGGESVEMVPVRRDHNSIRQYVQQRLSDARRHGRLTADPDDIKTVADLVAEQRERQILFARLVVHEILSRPALLQPSSRVQLDRLLTENHRGLFATAVRRLARISKLFGPLLEALAMTRGRGLPRSNGIWAIVAHAIIGDSIPDVTIEDLEGSIDRLLVEAAPYLMVDAEDGRSVYRLAHRTFQDYFQERVAAGPDRPLLVAAALVRAAAADRAVAASPYLRRHLAGHVAQAAAWSLLDQHHEVLDQLDPNTVATEVLRTAFGQADLPGAVAAVAGARDKLIRVDPADRPAIRAIATAQYSDEAPPLGAVLQEGSPWRWAWARVQRDPLHLTLDGHTGPVVSLTAVPLPDGRVLVATGGDRTVRLWDPTSGLAAMSPLTGHRAQVWAVAAASTDEWTVLVSGCGNGTLRFWNPVTGQLGLEVGDAHQGPVSVLAVVTADDGGPVLVSGGVDGTVRLWDPLTGVPIEPGPPRHPQQITAIGTCTHDGRTVLVTGCGDALIRLWSLPGCGPVDATPPRLIGRVKAVAEVSLDDGRTVLLAASDDAAVMRWHVPAAEAVEPPLVGHTDWVNATARVSDRFVGTAGNDGAVRLWNPNTGETAGRPLTGHRGAVHALATVDLPDGRTLLASGGDDKTVRLWFPDTASAAEFPASPRSGSVTSLAVSRGGGEARVAASTTEGKLHVWRVSTGQADEEFRPESALRVTAMAMADLPDGRTLLAVGGEDGEIELLNATTGRPIGLRLTAHDGRVTALTGLTRPDGRLLLASGGRDNAVRLWDTTTGLPYGPRLDAHREAITALIAVPTPDETLLASASRSRAVRLWRANGEPAGPALIRHTGRVSALAAIAPTGSRPPLFASAGEDGQVWLWNPATGRPEGPSLTGHAGGVNALTALELPDGHSILVTGGRDETVRLWNVDSREPLGVLRLGTQPLFLVAADDRLVVGTPLGVVALDVAGIVIESGICIEGMADGAPIG